MVLPSLPLKPLKERTIPGQCRAGPRGNHRHQPSIVLFAHILFSVRHFQICILGPKGSCFEGGRFNLEMFLPRDYPMVPPKVHFLTKIFHPNVDRVGRICLDILKDKWYEHVRA